MGFWNNFISRFQRTSGNDFLKGNWYPLVSSSSKSGVTINAKNALTISAVYAAVQLITDDLSSLPIQIFSDNGKTKNKLPKHPLSKLFKQQPNSLQTPYDFWQVMIPHLLLRGNAYALIEFDRISKRPVTLLPIHPDIVEPTLADGILYYKVKFPDNSEKVFDQVSMLHFRGLGDDIEKGKSVIEYAKDNLGLAKASEDFGSAYFKNGATPTGVLETDTELSQKAFDNISASFRKRSQGLDNASKTLILEQGLKWKSISIPPEQAQFLETRQHSVLDVCRWFKVAPHQIGELSNATFSNIEEQNLSYYKQTIRARVINIEQELGRKLLREDEKGKLYFRMNIDALLRGDIKTRYESFKIGVQNGWLSANEIRGMEEMNPYEGGDTYWMQTNTAPINEEGTNQPKVVEQPKNNNNEEDNDKEPIQST